MHRMASVSTWILYCHGVEIYQLKGQRKMVILQWNSSNCSFVSNSVRFRTSFTNATVTNKKFHFRGRFFVCKWFQVHDESIGGMSNHDWCHISAVRIVAPNYNLCRKGLKFLVRWSAKPWYSDYRRAVSKLSNNEFHTLACTICAALFAIALCPFTIALPCHGWELFLVVRDCGCSCIVPWFHPAFTHLHHSIGWHRQLW